MRNMTSLTSTHDQYDLPGVYPYMTSAHMSSRVSLAYVHEQYYLSSLDI